VVMFQIVVYWRLQTVKFIQNFKLGILILGERTFVFHNGSSRATKRIARHASIYFCLLKKFEISINLSFGQKKILRLDRRIVIGGGYLVIVVVLVCSFILCHGLVRLGSTG
jgi:hypothetical protein